MYVNRGLGVFSSACAGLLTVTLMICGCSPATVWVKDDATPAALAEAERQCAARVDDEVNRYEDWGSPVGRTSATERDLALWQAQSEVFSACMEELGFRLERAQDRSARDPTRALPRSF